MPARFLWLILVLAGCQTTPQVWETPSAKLVRPVTPCVAMCATTVVIVEGQKAVDAKVSSSPDGKDIHIIVEPK